MYKCMHRHMHAKDSVAMDFEGVGLIKLSVTMHCHILSFHMHALFDYVQTAQIFRRWQMKFTTTRSHLGAWCTRKLGILVVLLVLALLAYKVRESANISTNQSPAVVSVRHSVVAEPTKEPPEEEGACEETWSEATELKANLSSGVCGWGWGCGCGRVWVLQAHIWVPQCTRGPCRCGDKVGVLAVANGTTRLVTSCWLTPWMNST